VWPLQSAGEASGIFSASIIFSVKIHISLFPVKLKVVSFFLLCPQKAYPPFLIYTRRKTSFIDNELLQLFNLLLAFSELSMATSVNG